ncbi:MAG: SRPBCC family protein [Bacteroidota bacterium]
MLQWIFIVLGGLFGLIAILVIIGYLLPKKHKVTLSKTFKTSPEKVWQLIRNFEHYQQWRPGLKEVQVISDNTWKEIDKRNDKITLQIIEEAPHEKLVTKIIDDKLPFGGSWIFEISGEEEVALTITEDGEIYNPIFRFFAHFVFGYEATMKQYFNDLETTINQN